jgi:transcriptional regulator with XRE-family HTH domain
MDMRRLVGQNVKRIRLKNGLTQEQLAERSGFTQQYISGLERGRRNPTVVTVFELAQALGAGYLELLMPDDEAGEEGDARNKPRRDKA